MKRQLFGECIEYDFKVSKRARRMRLVVYCDGSLVATVPRGVGEGTIERFIHEKSAWILRKIEHFKKFPVKPFVAGNSKDFLENKDKALRLVEERIAHFNQTYQLRFASIGIRNQKTRWGSCSRNGRLNFNYRIALLSPALADYVIVHELCHLKEFNHSERFWNLVAQTIPNHRELRRELRKKGILSL